jgi:hypothetical protein
MITNKSYTEDYLHGLSSTELNYLSSVAEQALVLMELEPDSSKLRPILQALQPVLRVMVRDGYAYERPAKNSVLR